MCCFLFVLGLWHDLAGSWDMLDLLWLLDLDQKRNSCGTWSPNLKKKYDVSWTKLETKLYKHDFRYIVQEPNFEKNIHFFIFQPSVETGSEKMPPIGGLWPQVCPHALGTLDSSSHSQRGGRGMKGRRENTYLQRNQKIEWVGSTYPSCYILYLFRYTYMYGC